MRSSIEEALKAHSEAEYRRGLEDAAKEMDSVYLYGAAKIRSLKMGLEAKKGGE